MSKTTVFTTALGFALAAPASAYAAESRELKQLRAEIQQLKKNYETRIQALESKLQQRQAVASAGMPVPSSGVAPLAPPALAPSVATSAPGLSAMQPVAPPPTAVAASDAYLPAAAAGGGTPQGAPASGFNPTVSLILGGTYVNLSQDPNRYRLQGFMPGGDVGPGRRGLNLGESELTLAANIDPQFAGQLTFALTPADSVSVEEAFFQTQSLSSGVNLKAGRFLSSVGYLNSQHAHTWDFVDAPLAYQAFFSGQYKPDGLQLRWLAPSDHFFEIGGELGSGQNFPGNDHNRNGAGSTALFAHLGDDLGESASYRAGLSYLRTSASQRSFADVDSSGLNVVNAFTGKSSTWIADGIYKWAPNGNPVQTNLKLQGEYFRRTDRGDLNGDVSALGVPAATGRYRGAQSGWYLQSVYQFTAGWRAGLRYDRLDAGRRDLGSGLDPANFTQLTAYNPRRATLMLDYSPSEFSRFRVQFAQDRTHLNATDNQIFLQYIMSLGAHGAHTF